MTQMEDRFDIKERERNFLEKEKLDKPELFPELTFVDGDDFLENLGIYIPGKEKLPSGYLKFRPEDFIVEEIDKNNNIHEVSKTELQRADEDGQTIYATLVKYGLSTIEAQQDIAKILGIANDQIQYAGVKDKDALTAQKISIRGSDLEKVSNIKSSYFFLKDIYRSKAVVEKGGLKGNKFTILIRIGNDLKDKDKTKALLEALQNVKENGFYNFYYVQRFGHPRLNNFQWGISLLKGDLKTATESYLTDSGLREFPYFREKREGIAKAIPNWAAVLEILSDLPLIFGNEIKIVKHLIHSPNDFLGALKTIGEQVTFWVYGLSAYLYNRRLSSFLKAEVSPPEEISLFLSRDKNDWLQYSEDLENLGIFPPAFEMLRHFPQIQIKGVSVKTTDSVEIHCADIVDEGMILEFSLGKGEYATTFLSHLVNLVSGFPPADLMTDRIDTKTAIEKGNLNEIFEYFSPVLSSKLDNK